MKTLEDQNRDSFINGYIACALWSSSDTLPDGEVLESLEYETLAPHARNTLEKFALDFYLANEGLLKEAVKNQGYTWSHAGHDLWLTQNGHGAGYWDGDLPADIGEKLTDSAQKWREYNLYLGEGGLVYVN